MSTKDNIEKLIDSFEAEITKGSINSYLLVANEHSFVDAKECAQRNDFEEFYCSLIYPFFEKVGGLLSSLKLCDKARFIFTNSQYVEAHYKQLIKKYEGWPCCSDKSMTIVYRLLRFYTSSERVEFNPSDEYAYHHPKKVFTTHDQIVEFYEGIYNLHYGRPERYLHALHNITNAAIGKGSDYQ